MILSDFLKEQTKQYHDEIETKLESNKLFDGSFSEVNYYKMLQVNYQFLSAYEKAIRTFLTPEDLKEIPLTKLNKLDLIVSDLTELGLDLTEAKKQFELKSRAEAFGALYVIEGSMLGGNVIAKSLKKYEFLEDKSFNYFGHYGENLSAIWKTFLKYINQEFQTEQEQIQVLNGAKKAYQDLIDFA